jgi:hypothetical protein
MTVPSLVNVPRWQHKGTLRSKRFPVLAGLGQRFESRFLTPKMNRQFWLGAEPGLRHGGRVRVLIVGCGYVGLPLGAELVRRGHEVFGLRRTAEGAEELLAAGW